MIMVISSHPVIAWCYDYKIVYQGENLQKHMKQCIESTFIDIV